MKTLEISLVGKFSVFVDGQRKDSEFTVNADDDGVFWQQWGAPTGDLGMRSEVLQKIQVAIADMYEELKGSMT